MFRERKVEDKITTQYVAVCEGNITSEKIVGCYKNRELGNYGKFLYKKRGKREYLLGKVGSE